MVINWGDEQRNREARTGVSTSRKGKMMKPDKGNAIVSNDAAFSCDECAHHPECPRYEYGVELACICDTLPNPKNLRSFKEINQQ